MFTQTSTSFEVLLDALDNQYVLVFLTNNSSFSNHYEKLLLTYVEMFKDILPPDIKFYKFIITKENAHFFQVAKVPQLRYFVDHNEVGVHVGAFNYDDINNLIRPNTNSNANNF